MIKLVNHQGFILASEGSSAVRGSNSALHDNRPPLAALPSCEALRGFAWLLRRSVKLTRSRLIANPYPQVIAL
jgi:hypothetical protein